MIEDLFFIEKQAYGESPIHSLDARVKIGISFAAIIAIVSFPYSPDARLLGLVYFSLFLALWLLARLPLSVYAKRLVLILPFGLFLILFQIFFTNRYYPAFNPILDLPFGIHVYAESVEFATVLLAKFIVSVSFIILLSSTTKMQNLLDGFRRLGLPREFSLCIAMMFRYLFVFADMFRRIRSALETRCFDPFDRKLSYRYRLRQLGYTIGMIFIRSYEQGERTYTAMLCRGYGIDSHLPLAKKPLVLLEWVVLCSGISFVVLSLLAVYLFSL